jgi:hypothetical protein
MCTILARSGLKARYEPWVKVDIRRNSKRAHQYKRYQGENEVFQNIETCDLPELKIVALDIDDHKFDLYSGPLPISKAKYDDLVSLTVHLSPEAGKYYKSLPFEGSLSDSDQNSDCSESSEGDVDSE